MTDRVNTNPGAGADLRASTVLLYSDDPAVRERMRLAVGPRPAADLAVEFIEASTYAECVRIMDTKAVDLLLLDGEASPAGGLGIARQIRDEYNDVPPIVVTVARAADNWLAAFAQVDATIRLPLDPIETGQVVASQLRARANGGAALAG